jgi:hypothetical protein
MLHYEKNTVKQYSRIDIAVLCGGALSGDKRKYRIKLISTPVSIYKCGAYFYLISCVLGNVLRTLSAITTHVAQPSGLVKSMVALKIERESGAALADFVILGAGSS